MDILDYLTPPPNGFADASPRHNDAMKKAADLIADLRAQLAAAEARIAEHEAHTRAAVEAERAKWRRGINTDATTTTARKGGAE